MMQKNYLIDNNMQKIEIAELANAVAQVSNNGLEPKKGLKLYRFYQSLKAVQTEVMEYEQKLRKDYDIKEKDNDAEALKKYNEAFHEMLNEEADIKVEPFLTEEEAVDVFGKVLTMEGLDIILSMVARKCEEKRFKKLLEEVKRVSDATDKLREEAEKETVE